MAVHSTRVERTATVRSTGYQTGLYNRFNNRFDNRLYIHDTAGCQIDNRLYRVNGASVSLTCLLAGRCLWLACKTWSVNDVVTGARSVSQSAVTARRSSGVVLASERDEITTLRTSAVASGSATVLNDATATCW